MRALLVLLLAVPVAWGATPVEGGVGEGTFSVWKGPACPVRIAFETDAQLAAGSALVVGCARIHAIYDPGECARLEDGSLKCREVTNVADAGTEARLWPDGTFWMGIGFGSEVLGRLDPTVGSLA